MDIVDRVISRVMNPYSVTVLCRQGEELAQDEVFGDIQVWYVQSHIREDSYWAMANQQASR